MVSNPHLYRKFNETSLETNHTVVYVWNKNKWTNKLGQK